MTAQVAGMLLVLFKGIVPDALSIYAGNVILMSSMLFLLDGFRKFVGPPASWRANAVAFAAYMAAYFHFFAADPNMGMRNVLNCAIIVWIDGQCAFLLLVATAPRLRQTVRLAGLVMAGYVLASCVRAAIILSYPREAEVFRSGLADTIAILSYVSLHICLAIALVATITRRLMDEVQRSSPRPSISRPMRCASPGRTTGGWSRERDWGGVAARAQAFGVRRSNSFTGEKPVPLDARHTRILVPGIVRPGIV